MGFYAMTVLLQKDTTRKSTHITQNNTPRSNKTQRSKLHKEGHITVIEYNAKKCKAILIRGRGGL
jgi:hypothetical protein